MTPNSLRWRLPLSYIGLAMFTTLVFGGLLLTTLRVYYSGRERQYLSSNGSLLGQQLAFRLGNGAQISSMQPQTSAYARALQARIKVFDAADNLQLDSGSPGQLESSPSPFPITGRTPAPVTPLPGQNMVEEISIDVVAFAPGEANLSGQRSRQTVSVPLVSSQTGELLGRVELSEGPAYGAQIIAGVIRIGIWVALGAIIFGAAIGWVISLRLTRPLLALTNATTRMASGDLSIRTDIQRTDEIGLLARAFNQMVERMQQTVLTLRNFTADAAHELHNPLTALLTNLDLAMDQAAPGPDSPLLQARAQATHLAELTSDLLDLSRLETQEDPPIHQPLDLTVILREAAEIYASRAEQAGIDFVLKSSESPTIVLGNNLQVRRALGNILDNAIKFTPSGGTITVEIQKNKDRLQVHVTDTGLGVDPQDLPNLFDRFYRGNTASTYSGSGLGLAIVKAIMGKHEGDVTVKSSSDGTTFTLVWPIHDPLSRKVY